MIAIFNKFSTARCMSKYAKKKSKLIIINITEKLSKITGCCQQMQILYLLTLYKKLEIIIL